MKKVLQLFYYLVSIFILFGAAIQVEQKKIGQRVYLGNSKELAETLGVFIGMVLSTFVIAWALRKYLPQFSGKSKALIVLYIATIMALLFWYVVPASFLS